MVKNPLYLAQHEFIHFYKPTVDCLSQCNVLHIAHMSQLWYQFAGIIPDE